MNEISKEEMMKIQARTAETMSSLLRDLTDMGIDINPKVPNSADFSSQSNQSRTLMPS